MVLRRESWFLLFYFHRHYEATWCKELSAAAPAAADFPPWLKELQTQSVRRTTQAKRSAYFSPLSSPPSAAETRGDAGKLSLSFCSNFKRLLKWRLSLMLWCGVREMKIKMSAFEELQHCGVFFFFPIFNRALLRPSLSGVHCRQTATGRMSPQERGHANDTRALSQRSAHPQ